MTANKLQEIYQTWENGNTSEVKSAIKRMSKTDLLNFVLIATHRSVDNSMDVIKRIKDLIN